MYFWPPPDRPRGLVWKPPQLDTVEDVIHTFGRKGLWSVGSPGTFRDVCMQDTCVQAGDILEIWDTLDIGKSTQPTFWRGDKRLFRLGSEPLFRLITEPAKRKALVKRIAESVGCTAEFVEKTKMHERIDVFRYRLIARTPARQAAP